MPSNFKTTKLLNVLPLRGHHTASSPEWPKRGFLACKRENRWMWLAFCRRDLSSLDAPLPIAGAEFRFFSAAPTRIEFYHFTVHVISLCKCHSTEEWCRKPWWIWCHTFLSLSDISFRAKHAPSCSWRTLDAPLMPWKSGNAVPSRSALCKATTFLVASCGPAGNRRIDLRNANFFPQLGASRASRTAASEKFREVATTATLRTLAPQTSIPLFKGTSRGQRTLQTTSTWP